MTRSRGVTSTQQVPESLWDPALLPGSCVRWPKSPNTRPPHPRDGENDGARCPCRHLRRHVVAAVWPAPTRLPPTPTPSSTQGCLLCEAVTSPLRGDLRLGQSARCTQKNKQTEGREWSGRRRTARPDCRPVEFHDTRVPVIFTCRYGWAMANRPPKSQSYCAAP